MNKIFLSEEELVGQVDKIAACLRPFLSFSSCVVFFGQSEMAEAELLSAERCVIAPVLLQGRQLALLRLNGVKLRETRRILPFLPQIIALCVENVAQSLYRHRDAQTGLLEEGAFLQMVAHGMTPRDDVPLHARCFGLLIITWQNAESLRQRLGAAAVQLTFEKLVATIKELVPAEAAMASLGIGERRHELGILLPGHGRGFCHGLGRRTLAALESLEVHDPLSGASVRPIFTLGHAVFPQDISGPDLQSDVFSRALLLKDRARLAATAAHHCGDTILAYAWLLAHGGLVLEVSDRDRLKITLGSNCRAAVGMRFHLLQSSSRTVKGQIVLRQIASEYALAELIFLTDPAVPPYPGDRLALIHQAASSRSSSLLPHEEFVGQISEETRHLQRFVVSLTRFASCAQNQQPLDFLEKYISSGKTSLPPLIGLYGQNSLAMLWSQCDCAHVVASLETLHEAAVQADLQPCTGVVPWPFLDLGKQDWEEGCLKALEYAQLLHPPHIGILDATALTISGDKRFSQGDKLGAMDEYRRALLLKPGDAMILNSYGVVLAAMNRLESASQIFQQALTTCTDQALRSKIYYNLANIHQKENNLREARRYYRQCLRLDGNHIFAWLRLGQIAQLVGNFRAARALYSHAHMLAGEDMALATMTQRFLARLAAGASQPEKARELLHDALLRNPDDAPSLLLLAEAYLAEDPPMTEILARKALRLGAKAHEILAKSLEAQGRHEEARLARNKG